METALVMKPPRVYKFYNKKTRNYIIIKILYHFLAVENNEIVFIMINE